jgi:NAD(P)-dependent dehydrogenase (short-subunit alcohol dehydrogenase family)
MDTKSAKNAVITGAAYGLGKACALALARRGWRIGLVDIEVEEAEKTLREVERAGGSGEVCRCDVRRHEEVLAMADRFFSGWGRVDLLVNNAGVYGTACAAFYGQTAYLYKHGLVKPVFTQLAKRGML